MLFSGLEAQSEISRLLDELYDDLDDLSQTKEITNTTSHFGWCAGEHGGANINRFALEPELV